jgi:lipopolysaccharide transport system ATP-binding protein
MMEKILVKNVSKKFRIGIKNQGSVLHRIISVFSGKEFKREIDVLEDISFSVKSSEILGVIGDNGSGKSTLLRCIAKIYPHNKGKIVTSGKIISLINLNIGMQPKLILKDNVFLCCSFFGIPKKEIEKKFNSILEFSELQDYVNTKLYQFSNGMLQRLAFSIGINCNPDILLLDEVFEVGDEKFKNKSVKKIRSLVKEGVSIILVSHNLQLIQKYCDGVILMKKGKILEKGKPKEIIAKYRLKNY